MEAVIPAGVWGEKEGKQAGAEGARGGGRALAGELIYGMVKSGKPFEADSAMRGLACQGNIGPQSLILPPKVLCKAHSRKVF